MHRILLVATFVLPLPALAQHEHDSPYADLGVDARTTLPVEEVEALRAGEGMSLALTAELNGYPGPRHVLEMAERLGLSPAQRDRVAAIQRAMTEAAVLGGEAILTGEGELTRLFQRGAPDIDALEAAVERVGRLRGELRSIHLLAHVRTRDVLTDEQVATYQRHRGYRAR